MEFGKKIVQNANNQLRVAITGSTTIPAIQTSYTDTITFTGNGVNLADANVSYAGQNNNVNNGYSQNMIYRTQDISPELNPLGLNNGYLNTYLEYAGTPTPEEYTYIPEGAAPKGLAGTRRLGGSSRAR